MHKNLSGKLFCKRRSKINGQFRELNVAQPEVIRDYNMHMGGVDKSNQMISKYKVLRRTTKFWKTLLYHFLDIARVNAFIMFKRCRTENQDLKELNMPDKFS